MQNVSPIYTSIMAGEHDFRTQVDFVLSDDSAVTLTEDSIISLKTRLDLFTEDLPMIGCACSAMCDLTILKPDFQIPRMGEFALWVKAFNENSESHWVPKGTFFVDTRKKGTSAGNETVIIHGYDAMMRAEASYPNTSHSWPYLDLLVVNEIASRVLGVDVDPRVVDVMTSGYMIPLPDAYSCREVLCYIAAMYGGCFYITDMNALRLIRLNEVPAETDYLIDMAGNRITFGGNRLLLS